MSVKSKMTQANAMIINPVDKEAPMNPSGSSSRGKFLLAIRTPTVADPMRKLNGRYTGLK